MDLSGHPVLIVMVVAVVSSLLAEIRIGIRVPVIVWELLFGMLIGPHVLALVRSEGLLEWLGGLGLAALFFMTGMDLELQKVKGRPLTLALCGWAVSLTVAFAVAGLLHVLPFVDAPIMVALALTTTSLGTLMPILRDSGRLDSNFGNLVVAAGTLGEFGPIIIVSLVLTHKFGAWQEAALMLAFVAVAFAAAIVALWLRPPRILALIERTMNSTTPLPVCFSLLLLAAFDVLSARFGLETVLGAFAAGMVVSLASQDKVGKVFRGKMAAICFGFFVPFFFVVSGMNLDLGALLHSGKTMLLVPVFLILLLLVRGAPVILYCKDLAKDERLPFALYSATGLSMLVAIAALGVRTGRMQANVAAAVVGAGLLSVLLFPMIAGAVLSRSPGIADSQGAS